MKVVAVFWSTSQETPFAPGWYFNLFSQSWTSSRRRTFSTVVWPEMGGQPDPILNFPTARVWKIPRRSWEGSGLRILVKRVSRHPELQLSLTRRLHCQMYRCMVAGAQNRLHSTIIIAVSTGGWTLVLCYYSSFMPPLFSHPRKNKNVFRRMDISLLYWL